VGKVTLVNLEILGYLEFMGGPREKGIKVRMVRLALLAKTA